MGHLLSLIYLRVLAASVLLFSLISLGRSQIVNPFVGAEPSEWTQAKEAAQKIEALPDTNGKKLFIGSIFATAKSRFDSMVGGSHPIWLKASGYGERMRLHRIDSDKYDEDDKKYQEDGVRYRADSEAYKAAGGGGTYDVNDPKYAMLQSWWARLDSWYKTREAWRVRLSAWAKTTTRKTKP